MGAIPIGCRREQILFQCLTNAKLLDYLGKELDVICVVSYQQIHEPKLEKEQPQGYWMTYLPCPKYSVQFSTVRVTGNCSTICFSWSTV
jgi:hypothetical protein